MNALLQSLDIEGNLQARGPLGGQLSEFEQLWKEGYAQQNAMQNQLVLRQPLPLADQWADDFQKQFRPRLAPQSWADEFQNQQNGDQWANQFQEVKFPPLHLLHMCMWVILA